MNAVERQHPVPAGATHWLRRGRDERRHLMDGGPGPDQEIICWHHVLEVIDLATSAVTQQVDTHEWATTREEISFLRRAGWRHLGRGYLGRI